MDDYYKMSYYESSKTYVLCMISTCYVIYVMIVDHALIVKFYPFLVCLFLVKLPFVVVHEVRVYENPISNLCGE